MARKKIEMDWIDFLELLRKKGWEKIHEDDHMLVFRNEKGEEVVFSAYTSQEDILQVLESANNLACETEKKNWAKDLRKCLVSVQENKQEGKN